MSASEAAGDNIIYPATEWNANDYANIITISAAAISSVLLVIFKSRCKTIDLCCGFINCLRDPMDEEDIENNNNNNNNNNNENNDNDNNNAVDPGVAAAAAAENIIPVGANNPQ